jgi:CheY-like chemotaxis protein
MTFVILVAGLDGRSLLLEASVLQRETHRIEELLSGRGLLERIAQGGSQLAVIGVDLPDFTIPDLVRRIRAGPTTRRISILALVPTSEPTELDTETLFAGANAVLRRPLDRPHLDTWLSKLLEVPRRVEARVPVAGRVVGSPRSEGAGHFVGLSLNVSSNGMLLASPVRLVGHPDVDLELDLPPAFRLKALGRVVREAGEVQWPYLGYGVEFLYVPEESLSGLLRIISSEGLPAQAARSPAPRFGIHSTLRRDPWIFEILQPVAHGEGYHVEIHRSPRELWRPGQAGPFYVVEAATPQEAIALARAFVMTLG